ncbi:MULTISPECIES: NAD(P)/FAD-dependent oxidoreductase [unclassified Clostridium]|uniref:NAD(P)/FAD-dependent oxidoreductase n=1 Tax=unclassified Clostridium TaxID=2614128 RepID=UPI001106E32F|nr:MULTISPECIES: NAD(P)/FAD-dependent oxidoreductase [unclassified Clostridium]
MDKKRLVVVGGGPAGMMAAGIAAQKGCAVTLLERNEKLGKKLYITGKGRCNLTNACAPEEWMDNLPRNGKFMFSAFNRFNNRQVMDFFEALGVPLKVERGNRVFPVSDKASDINRALERYLRQNGVEVLLSHRVESLEMDDECVSGVLANGKRFPCEAVVIATGGLSYPSTGSTGDGLAWAKGLGLKTEPTYPSLIPIETREDWPAQLQGLSLRNVALTARRNKKVLYEEQGEMLFTHYGVSGPLVLSASSHIAGLALNEIELSIDLKPALTLQQLDARLVRDFEKYSNKQFVHAVKDLFPQRMVEVMVRLSGIAPQKTANQLTRAERAAFAALIKDLPLHPKALRPIEEAIITRGGISVREIDPKSMRAKRYPNLFFAGEMLDVDGYTGGFNLQIAFSTGYLAGVGAAQEMEN